MTSELGKNFEGIELNESTLDCDQLIVYNNKIYISGNRGHDLVELWNLPISDSGKFIKTVSMKKIKLFRQL